MRINNMGNITNRMSTYQNSTIVSKIFWLELVWTDQVTVTNLCCCYGLLSRNKEMTFYVQLFKE